MRRFALLSSLLLPLPFAALPLLAVLAGGVSGPASGDVVLNDRTPLEAPLSPASLEGTLTQSLSGDPCDADPALAL